MTSTSMIWNLDLSDDHHPSSTTHHTQPEPLYSRNPFHYSPPSPPRPPNLRSNRKRKPSRPPPPPPRQVAEAARSTSPYSSQTLHIMPRQRPAEGAPQHQLKRCASPPQVPLSIVHISQNTHNQNSPTQHGIAARTKTQPISRFSAWIIVRSSKIKGVFEAVSETIPPI